MDQSEDKTKSHGKVTDQEEGGRETITRMHYKHKKTVKKITESYFSRGLFKQNLKTENNLGVCLEEKHAEI